MLSLLSNSTGKLFPTSISQTLLWLAALIVLTPLSIALYNLYLHPLRKYPGSTIYCAFRLPWVIALQRGVIHRTLLDHHNKYGQIVRVAPNELSYIHPEAIKDIYQNPRIPRADVWFRSIPGEPTSIMGSDEDSHARYKRAFLGGFTEKATREHASVMSSYIDLMIQRFRQMCSASTTGEITIDIIDWLNMVTFDVSGDLSFGSSFGSTANGEAHPWVNISNQFGKGIALMASLNFYPLFAKFARKFMPKRAMENIHYHKSLTVEKVGERLTPDAVERKDFIQCVLDHNSDAGMREKGKQVTRSEIEVNMPVVLFAGSETTSSAIGSALWYLLRRPVWLEKVQNEVRGSFASESEIDMINVAKLATLTAVVQEGLRLGPPSVIGVPRVVGPGGENVCGRFVPAGTMLAMNQYPAFRSALNFPDPVVFDPGRFLGTEDISPVFRPFLTGRHVCIGEKFAWAEMRLILAKILFNFDVSLGARSDGADDWGDQKTFIFWQKERLALRLKSR